MSYNMNTYYKKDTLIPAVEKDRSNKISTGSPTQRETTSSHKNKSGHKSYKMQNTSKHRQSKLPYNIENRRKITSTDENSNTTPMCATSSWFQPPISSKSLQYKSLLEGSPSKSTVTSLKTADISVIEASSTSPSSSSIDSKLLHGWSPVPTTSTDTSHWFAQINNCRDTTKRKRQDSVNEAQHDPDLGCDLPSAKRKQTLPSPYTSDVSSVASSVYPSPIDGFSHEIDTRSSCDYLSAGTDFEATADCIPDSPSSLRPDDEVIDVEDDEIVSATTSPSSECSTSCSKDPHHLYKMHAVTQLGERTPGQITQNTGKNIETKLVKAYDDDYTGTPYNCMTPATEPDELRQCPLPALSWANAYDVWQLMCKKDHQAAFLRSGSMLERHPSLQPRMRAILLDWLIEVCEVYKLHRESYYLAVDYLDRYLSTQKNVQKTHLQLIGITCLFVAAKVEEIYPPKIGEFAYVTDGACQESDILQHEVLLLQALEWSINPVTPMGWLGVYMQLNVNNRTPASFKHNTYKAKSTATTDEADKNDAFIYPQFSGMEFVQTAQLLDLCSLDLGIADYGYSIIAAAAMSHTFNREVALRCSGFDWQTIEPCARWMRPFFEVVREESTYLPMLEQNEQFTNRFGLGHICPNIITDDSHIIQTHTISMEMFDRTAQLLELAFATKNRTEASPATGLLCPDGLLTPPASSRKPVDATDVDEDPAPTTVQRIKSTTAKTRKNSLAKSTNSAIKVEVSAEKNALT
nr:G1/S-specific cyclin-E isoform X1 [Bactrocera oleae]XP_036220786.1 G1/S-specific cyclin-E isoform X1 [Bactrocera oleae]XP_036220787.1 G1/S-specific cyclin-E isoform X1 [Bactrocera oleae]XP_036220788.1 G1/S-specific cyclin-E isoform X1 [Bactrocera oleae]XP_036220789.1 G1/S-specific cyclin-E isoform X1 [Bactrocera oleae]XP_036220790.1 G1/S-specific cyclin-E isoform X1 [Bactrocera oleae]